MSTVEPGSVCPAVRAARDDQTEEAVALTDTENHLIQVQGVFSASLAIAGVFLALYLVQLGDFRTIALFYLGQYSFQIFFFIVAGYLMRNRSAKYVIRLGLLVLVALYGLLLVLGDDARGYAFWLGALSGVGEGLYWPGINLNEYIATHNRTRNLYYGKLFLYSNLASVIGLPLSGIVLYFTKNLWLPQSGYYVLFATLMLVLLVTYKLSAGVATSSGVKFSLADIRKHRRTPAWRLVLAMNFCRGLWAYTLPAYSAVLLFEILADAFDTKDPEFALGVLTAVATVAVGWASLAAGKILQRRRSAYVVGALVVPIGMLGFAFNQNLWGVFYYAVLVLCFETFAQNTQYKAMYDVMDGAAKHWSTAYHFIVEREVFWNLGRVVSFGALGWALLHGDQLHTLTFAIGLIAVLPLVNGVLQWAYHRAMDREGVSS